MSDKKEGYPKSAPGHKVSSKDIAQKNITYTWWEPMVQYSWSLGPAMSRFLQELKAGKIIGKKCDKCDRILVPPRMFCERCYGLTGDWVYVKDTGTIETFSIAYIDANANRIKDPMLIGVISFDGAHPKPMGIMHYFREMTKDEIKIGMKVKAVWKPENEREGAITDIKYFRPLKEGEE